MWLRTEAPARPGVLFVTCQMGDAPTAYFGGLNTSTATNIAGSVPNIDHDVSHLADCVHLFRALRHHCNSCSKLLPKPRLRSSS